ncbi:MAG: Gfo/Idh/MocA family oxidoreductase [Terriglobia bacterium]
MKTDKQVSRRDFIRVASAIGIVTPIFIPSHVWGAKTPPSDRLTMGFIGVGKQNRYLLNKFLAKDTQVVAVCDVDTTRREAAKQLVEDAYAQKAVAGYQGCTAYDDFRELLARKDIDAVCIASPDHWHAIHVVMAAKAKKDIYCEKPLSLTIPEARAMVKAVRKHKRVLQTGSMQRSSPEFYKACMLVRNGRIGKIKWVIVDVGTSSKWCDLPEEAMEPGLNWDMWLGPAPMRAYNSILSPRGIPKDFPAWRNYREYSGGGMTDWGAHHFDIAQWGLGMDDSGPVEIVPPEDPKAMTGVRFIYANGVQVIHGKSGGVLFDGTDGQIFVNRGKFKITPEGLDKDPIPENGVQLYQSTDHYQDFLNCVKTRNKPICDVEIGCRSASVCHLGNLSYWYRRTLHWDPVKERFTGDAEANTWLDRARRPPWQKSLG